MIARVEDPNLYSTALVDGKVNGLMNDTSLQWNVVARLKNMNLGGSVVDSVAVAKTNSLGTQARGRLASKLSSVQKVNTFWQRDNPVDLKVFYIQARSSTAMQYLAPQVR